MPQEDHTKDQKKDEAPAPQGTAAAQPPALAPCEYKTGKTLGQGSYGVVKEAIKIATNEKFAIKLISKKLMKGKERLVMNEIDILKKISKGNNHIITLHDYFESPNNLYLVMDLCTGGELFEKIVDKGYFYEKDAAKIIKTTCEAVAYLHDNHIVHRDLKPENLIFKGPGDDAELMIADFGLSKFLLDDNDTALRTYAGTPGYMAPEVIQKTGHGKPVDLWAIGVMTFFLLSGTLPFEDSSQTIELNNVLSATFDYDDEYWHDISKEAMDFISKLIIVDASKRLTAKQCLKHTWLQEKTTSASQVNLLPKVSKGFDARKMFKKAFDVIKAVHLLSSTSINKSGSGSQLTSARASYSDLTQVGTDNTAPRLYLANQFSPSPAGSTRHFPHLPATASFTHSNGQLFSGSRADLKQISDSEDPLVNNSRSLSKENLLNLCVPVGIVPDTTNNESENVSITLTVPKI